MTPYRQILRLKEINFAKLSDRDRVDILNHIIAMLTEVTGSDPYLDKLLTLFTMIRDRLESAMNKSRSNSFTALIDECNATRKTIISKMVSGLAFFDDSDDPDINRAVKDIERSFNKLLHLPDQKKRTLSAAINVFLENMEDSRNVTAAEKILFTDKIAKLKRTHEQMDRFTQQRAQNEELDLTPNLTPVRDEMFLFYNVLNEVLFLNVALKEEGMEELVHKLNGRIGQIMATARSLYTLEEHKQEAAEGENSTEEE